MRVYLAGPIAGNTVPEAKNWRFDVNQMIKSKQHGITCISPLRCEPNPDGDQYKILYDNDPLYGTYNAIGAKNNFDTLNCDITLAYLPKPKLEGHQSYGTLIEVAWSKAHGKPCIVVSNDPDVFNHPLIKYCSDWVLKDLNQAVELIVGLLGGYVGGKNI